MSKHKHKTDRAGRPQHGFTLIEILVGAAVMLLLVLGTLFLYMRSSQISVDQQQFTKLQHDVRSAMFLIGRDARSAGVGLTPDIAGFFIEGEDGLGPGPEGSDSLKVLGNFDDPLFLIIEKYQGGAGGGAATAFLYDWTLENAPYDCPGYYENRMVLIISTQCPGCFTFRYIPPNSVHGCGSGIEHFNMQPGQSELNPPGGLIDTGCAEACWDDAIVTLGQIKYYWLDTTGNPGDYPALALTVGQKGYLGEPQTLYLTTIDESTGSGTMMHLPLAQNIENLQFQYNGDLDNDGLLDGWMDWDPSWTGNTAIIELIQQIRIQVLGRTPEPFKHVSKAGSSTTHLYRRPALANSPLMAQDDYRRRFLLESTATIRNMSLDLYNTGARH
jgi:prepilin-type N-terminal cleavage/methylation domain-containing protein